MIIIYNTKILCQIYLFTDGLDGLLDTKEDFITAELAKQKKKLRDISGVLDNQHQLLRLIVQKMEIKTEADDVDEGIAPSDIRPVSAAGGGGAVPGSGQKSSRWNSPRIRNKLKNSISFSKSLH